MKRRLLGLCLLSLLASCGGIKEKVRPVDLAVREDRLLRGNGAEPESLDPHLASSVSAGNVLMNLFEGLTRLNSRTLEPEPGMASAWEVSADGLQIDFYLREAQWSDGEAVRASDFVFAFRRLLHPDLGAAYAFMLYPLRNAREVNAGSQPPEALGVEALGDRHLRLTLAKPTPYIFSLLAHWTAFPLPTHVLRAHGNETNRGGEWTRDEHFTGNGAFVLKAWKSEDRILLEKNPRYWQAEEVALQSAAFISFSDPGAEERAFRAGEIHVGYSLPRHRLTHYRETQPELLRVDPYLESVGYAVNLRHPALQDVRVRRALSLALDRRALTEKILFGVRQPAFTYVPPGTAGFESAYRLREDQTEARRLLAEAGYPAGSGFPEMVFIYPSGQDTQRIAEVIQQQWQEVLGVRMEIVNLERQSYFSRRREREFDLCYFAWVGDYVDPVTFLGLWVTDAGNNLAGWQSADYDHRLQAAAHGGGERLNLLAEAEALLLQDLPILPLYFGATQYLKDPRVQGWDANLLDWHPLRSVRFQ